MEDSDNEGLISRLEQSAKLIAVFVIVSYGVGIMISNMYLATLGLADFDLLRPRAVLSGLWFIVFFAVGVIAEESIQRAYKLKGIPFTWLLGNVLVAFFGAFFFYFFVFLFAHAGQHADRALVKAWILMPLLMFVMVGSVVTQVQYAMKEWRRRKTDEKVGPISAAFFISHCMFALIALVVFASLFITHYYRFVSQEYGGGKPRSVQMAVSDKAASALKGMSVVTTENLVEGPVELIHETSDDVAFRSNGGNTIILPRREILAIRIK